MNVNVTFFVQIINFYIFYSLIKFFLFKPTIKVIDQDNNNSMMLENLVDQLKKSIEINEKERQQNWHIYREYAKIHCPNYDEYDRNINKQFINENHFNTREEGLSTEDIRLLVQGVEQILGEKIKHVH